jgi:hypothetical protein
VIRLMQIIQKRKRDENGDCLVTSEAYEAPVTVRRAKKKQDQSESSRAYEYHNLVGMRDSLRVPDLCANTVNFTQT